MRQIFKICVLAATIVVGSASTLPAQTTAVGPYYATPSWDQKLQCDTLATCPRFVVLSPLGSAAVLDRETGLVWERSPTFGAVPNPWDAAIDNCNTLSVGSRFGWRLPSVAELGTLIEGAGAGAALPHGHPFQNIQPGGYWTATTFGSTSAAYVFDFQVGFFDTATKTQQKFAWCVRGAGPQ